MNAQHLFVHLLIGADCQTRLKAKYMTTRVASLTNTSDTCERTTYGPGPGLDHVCRANFPASVKVIMFTPSSNTCGPDWAFWFSSSFCNHGNWSKHKHVMTRQRYVQRQIYNHTNVPQQSSKVSEYQTRSWCTRLTEPAASTSSWLGAALFSQRFRQ